MVGCLRRPLATCIAHQNGIIGITLQCFELCAVPMAARTGGESKTGRVPGGPPDGLPSVGVAPEFSSGTVLGLLKCHAYFAGLP